MNLTSVKYQDSCIYIGLVVSQEGEVDQKFLEKIRNLYAVYKIKACDSYVRDTILVRKQDLTVVRGEIVVKFELDQLHRPEECEIEIISLKFIFRSGKREELNVNKSYSFLEIRAQAPIPSNKKKVAVKRIFENKSQKALSVRQEVVFSPPEKKEKKELNVSTLPEKKNEQKSQDILIAIEETTPPSAIVSEVEAKVEHKLDAQTKKLEIDINQLCYETLDSLLTSLPQPELAEEYRASNAMVKSIRRYINDDLLQKETEEGESA